MKMKPIIVISVVLLGLLSSAFVISVANVSGAVLTMWTHTYGGPSSDWAFSVVQTNDGGYAVAGYGAGGANFWLVKTDSSGNMLWNQSYGGGIGFNEAMSVVQTNDGGYAVAGYAGSWAVGPRVYCRLVKTDSSGNMQWNKTYGGTSIDQAYSVVQTSDGGYAVTGVTGSFGAGGDFLLVKTDSSGNQQWNRTYGGTSVDYAYSAVQTSDGGYALAGYTDSSGAGGYDFLLVKTDSSGDAQWSQTYGGTSVDIAQSLIQASDGGYVLAGYTTSFGAGGMDFYLVKTDEFGVVPEFPSMLLLPVLVLFTAVVAVLSRKRPLRTIKR